jgi:FMN reductase
MTLTGQHDDRTGPQGHITTPGLCAPTSAAPGGVVALSGNPRVGSRTLGIATAVATRIADLLDANPITTVDLAAFAPQILASEHPEADGALATVASAKVVVVATPIYKASYTGLLKAFLDLFGPGGLDGVVAVPLVVSGNPAHSLAGEIHLRPVLVELGAVVPTRTLALVESQLSEPDGPVGAWLAQSVQALLLATGSTGPSAEVGSQSRPTTVDAARTFEGAVA